MRIGLGPQAAEESEEDQSEESDDGGQPFGVGGGPKTGHLKKIAITEARRLIDESDW